MPTKKLNKMSNMEKAQDTMEKYLKEFRVEQCPLFLQHKCQQHRPFTCFNWHFQNQKRRRPVRRRDGTFNYSADNYCEKYDETTGICPNGEDCTLLHRTAGDTERRYHLRYYKTGMCVHDTDNRGFCVKNGPHCAFAHGANDLRPPVYDIKEMQAIENGEVEDNRTGPNSLDKERSLLNDDPKWLDTPYVLTNYKTEPCKKPPRLCRQGYACPQYHNNKDRRRSPKKYKYRSTPCPSVKTADEWGDPVNCDSGDNCQYCHTRTEQQFHPEIYKSTKCNDIQNTSYCPRGAFCAFAHIEQETLDHGAGGNFMDFHPLDHSDSSSDRSSNSGEIGEYPWGEKSRAPGSHLKNLQNINGDSINGSCSIPTSPTYKMPPSPTYKIRTPSGDASRLRNQLQYIENDPSLGPGEKSARRASLLVEMGLSMSSGSNLVSTINNSLSNIGSSLFSTSNQMESVGNGFEEMSINDLYEGGKSRKSSGFSEGEKSRNCSGMDGGDKSRNCSGNSISQGLVSSGFLPSNPVNIPGQDSFLDRNDSLGGLLTGRTSDLGDSGYLAGLNNTLGFQGGLFDFGPQTNNSVKDAEIARLREELGAARAKLSSWEESMIQARTACDAWKKEAAMSKQKAEMAIKEKDVAVNKVSTLQKEIEQLSGGPLLHALRRISDLPSLPPAMLKTIEWQLRKDIAEVERASRQQSEQQIWLSNNRVMENVIPDWSLGLNMHQPLYSSMQQ
ncbi:RING finger protein unkempt isoform X2 [Eurytemora carolleeae]|uniref:RING finger protein unkempt isoform X2 n=1 Tax=Eurytemora carolleeae TaxID=1294199 RepID=UPI000C79022A|nr:RING finger protein unkempt isoform X2 [Eurytemora carolleeae]|eukprot:XP_023342010.1 RING finger protein unkempt-like isoform X2 [Eurytemora affinis]